MSNQVDMRIRNCGLAIRIKMGQGIGLYKSVLRELGCPTHIHFWWSENAKALLVGACEEETLTSISISQSFYTNKSGLIFSNKRLMRAICRLTGWQNDFDYKLVGEFIPELNMVAFKTDTVAEVQANEQ